MITDIIVKRIANIETEFKQLKEELGIEVSKKINRFKLLDLFGCWEGEIDTFLNELYNRRERKGRLNEQLSS